MKAIRMHRTGSVEELRYEDAPDPVPAPGEIVVRVRAAGINWGDILHRANGYDGPPPWVPGLELAGEVVDGNGGPYAIGQRVYGRTNPGCMGGYAELAAVEAGRVWPVPEQMSDAEAGGAPVVFITAWHALHVRGHVQEGETVLVHAGGGGVGTAAIQVARALGARVIATAGSPEKVARTREVGADEALSYLDPEWPTRVRELTRGRGVDLVVDGVGEATFAGNFETLAQRGRVALLGTPSGVDGQVNIRRIMRGQWEIHGFATADEDELARGLPSFRERVLPMLASGKVKVIVGRTLPLSQAPQAHRLLEERGVFGKICLVP